MSSVIYDPDGYDYEGAIAPLTEERPMSTTITGLCERAYQNPKNGLCSLLVNDTFYSTYKTLYPDMEGKVVEFQAVQKGKFWNVTGEPKVVAEPAATTTTKASGPNAYDNRQSSIVLQSSYKTAADITAAMAAQGLIKLPTKQADQFDAYLNYVDEVALRLYRNCINPDPFVNEAEVEEDPAPAGWNAAEA